jgi:hypothetical protein
MVLAREYLSIWPKEILLPVDNRLMSFFGVLKVIGSLQLVSCSALVVYAVGAWRRKPPEPESPAQFGSVPQTLKLLSDLHQSSRPTARWKPRSPLARAEAELWREAELLRGESSLVPSHSPALPEGEESLVAGGSARA